MPGNELRRRRQASTYSSAKGALIAALAPLTPQPPARTYVEDQAGAPAGHKTRREKSKPQPEAGSGRATETRFFPFEKPMGGCQNYGPLLGPVNFRCCIMLRTPKRTIILTTTLMGAHGRTPRNVCRRQSKTHKGTAQ